VIARARAPTGTPIAFFRGRPVFSGCIRALALRGRRSVEGSREESYGTVAEFLDLWRGPAGLLTNGGEGMEPDISMQLGGGERRIALRLARYQFADATDEHDANWLVVDGEVRFGELKWRFVDPCLLTWEIDELIHLLERAADEPSTPGRTEFLEPLLAFAWNGAGVLQIALDAEAKPDVLRGAALAGDPLRVELRCGPDELRRAARELALQRRNFPRRASA
jgi:hypothetical protein